MEKQVKVSDAAPLLIFADDDADTRALVRLLFENAGFNVRTVDSAEALIDEVNRLCEEGECPDAIVSDVNFFNSEPRSEVKLTGIGAAFRIHKKFKNLPILFLTGATDTITRENAKQAANADVMTKPFSPSELVARVRDALRFCVVNYEGSERRSFGINRTNNCRRRTDRRVEYPETVARVLAQVKAGE